jgi:cell division protein FtsZ
MSLFGGRPRYDAPAPAPAPRSEGRGSAAAAQAAAQQIEPQPIESHEDLEIPSFLRRLAN